MVCAGLIVITLEVLAVLFLLCAATLLVGGTYVLLEKWLKRQG